MCSLIQTIPSNLNAFHFGLYFNVIFIIVRVSLSDQNNSVNLYSCVYDGIEIGCFIFCKKSITNINVT